MPLLADSHRAVIAEQRPAVHVEGERSELDAPGGHGRSVVEFAEFRNFSEPDLGLRHASQSMLWPLKTFQP
jgi:hypothetical protein